MFINTAKGCYTIQYFYKDAKQTAAQRHASMEKVLGTICLVNEIPAGKKAKQVSTAQATQSSTATKTVSSSSKIFVMNGTTLVKYKGKAFEVKVPEDVTVIGEGAFSGNEDVHRVHLKKGVISIESNAFTDMKLWELTVPATVTYIADDAIICQQF